MDIYDVMYYLMFVAMVIYGCWLSKKSNADRYDRACGVMMVLSGVASALVLLRSITA